MTDDPPKRDTMSIDATTSNMWECRASFNQTTRPGFR
jgi:hypothetical protein